jgi:hypothetical protein
LYRIQVAVESHAGQSTFSIPVQANTSYGDVPQFSLSNVSCINKKSYLVKWFIQNDGRTPISRAEISYAKVNFLITVQSKLVNNTFFYSDSW